MNGALLNHVNGLYIETSYKLNHVTRQPHYRLMVKPAANTCENVTLRASEQYIITEYLSQLFITFTYNDL